MTKEEEIINFLSEKIFNDVLVSKNASKEIKSGVNLTIARLKSRDAPGMISYFWSAVGGTENSISFARRMKAEGFVIFEDILEEFRSKFNDKWIRS